MFGAVDSGGSEVQYSTKGDDLASRKNYHTMAKQIVHLRKPTTNNAGSRYAAKTESAFPDAQPNYESIAPRVRISLPSLANSIPPTVSNHCETNYTCSAL